jgi:hypothetical protein
LPLATWGRMPNPLQMLDLSSVALAKEDETMINPTTGAEFLTEQTAGNGRVE